MNNIRKIITERLDNAKNDYKYYQGGSSEFYEYSLFEISGQILAYQDCLNLMQPRTEADILKDFEKLGYNVAFVSKENRLLLYKTNGDTIFIYKNTKEYEKCDVVQSINLTMQEHKLLNELFEVWQWI